MSFCSVFLGVLLMAAGEVLVWKQCKQICTIIDY